MSDPWTEAMRRGDFPATWDIAADALAPVGEELRTQHGVPLAQRAYRGFQARRVELAGVQFLVQLAGHPAKAALLVAAQPVGLLQGCQFEAVADRGRGRLRRGHRAGALGEQAQPGLQGRSLHQLGEADPHAMAGQQRGQAHEVDGVQALFDQRQFGVDVGGVAAQGRREPVAQAVWIGAGEAIAGARPG